MANQSFHRTLRKRPRRAGEFKACVPGMARNYVGESPAARF